jgi:ribosomal protein S10
MVTKTKEKIRVKLESFNHELLTSSCQKIVNLMQNVNFNNLGIVSLPTCGDRRTQ